MPGIATLRRATLAAALLAAPVVLAHNAQEPKLAHGDLRSAGSV